MSVRVFQYQILLSIAFYDLFLRFLVSFISSNIISKIYQTLKTVTTIQEALQFIKNILLRVVS